MATNTVGTIGDYANLAAWETARQGSSDATEIAVMQDEAHTGTVEIAGWTNSLEVIIRGETTQDGSLSSGARWSLSSGTVVQHNDADIEVTLEDLTCTITGGFFSRFFNRQESIVHPAGHAFAFRRLFIDCTAPNFGNGALTFSAISVASGQVVVDIDNCILNGFSGDSTATEFGYNGGSRVQAVVNIRGCTLYGSRVRAAVSNADTNLDLTATGCLFIPASGEDDILIEGSGGTATFTSTYNITSDSSTDHNANWDTVTGLSAGVTFVSATTPTSGQVAFTDVSSDDYSLIDHANNLAIDYVTSGSMPATDILGNTRDANPDAGAFEVVSSGVDGSGTPSIASVPTSSGEGRRDLTTDDGGNGNITVPTSTSSGELNRAGEGSGVLLEIPTMSGTGTTSGEVTGEGTTEIPEIPTMTGIGGLVRRGGGGGVPPGPNFGGGGGSGQLGHGTAVTLTLPSVPETSGSGSTAPGAGTVAGAGNPVLPVPESDGVGNLHLRSGTSTPSLLLPTSAASGARVLFGSGAATAPVLAISSAAEIPEPPVYVVAPVVVPPGFRKSRNRRQYVRQWRSSRRNLSQSWRRTR